MASRPVTLRLLGRIGRAVWLRVPFAWSLQMSLLGIVRRREMREVRGSWLGNEAQLSKIENSYLLLRRQLDAEAASNPPKMPRVDVDSLSRAETAARRTH